MVALHTTCECLSIARWGKFSTDIIGSEFMKLVLGSSDGDDFELWIGIVLKNSCYLAVGAVWLLSGN